MMSSKVFSPIRSSRNAFVRFQSAKGAFRNAYVAGAVKHFVSKWKRKPKKDTPPGPMLSLDESTKTDSPGLQVKG